MKEIAAPRSGRITSRLGLGCATLVGGLERRRSLRLIETALETGFRHFDVAPSYGMGTAEDVLGEALARRRDDVTLATKVGLPRPGRGELTLLARSLAAPVRRLVPALTRKLGARVAERSVGQGRYDLEFVRGSVESSLRRLRTDHLDILLLHEARAEDLTEEFVTWLDRQRDAGIFAAIGVGVGGDGATLAAINDAFPGVFDVWQYAWDVAHGPMAPTAPPGFSITHRSIAGALAALPEGLCEQLGVDPRDEAALATALIGAALRANPNGIVLAGTRRPARLLSYARAGNDAEVRSAARDGTG